MTRTIAILLIACGLLFGCDEDDAGDDAADSAEESSSSDAGESGSDDSTGELEPWEEEAKRCGEIVECIDLNCDAEREEYEACRETGTCGFDALYGYEACAMKCAEPADTVTCSPDGEICAGPYPSAWSAASDCVFTELSSCELDGAALCESY